MPPSTEVRQSKKGEALGGFDPTGTRDEAVTSKVFLAKLKGDFKPSSTSFTDSGHAVFQHHPTGDKLMIPVGTQGSGEGTVEIWWSIAYNVKPPKGELEIKPVDAPSYDEWLPRPIDDKNNLYAMEDDTSDPEPLIFQAEIKPKKNEKITGGANLEGRIDFYLTDVTRHKGKCTNYPKNEPEKYDLRFAAKQGDPDIIVDPNNPLHAYTKNKASVVTIMVEALDTGAYGNLRAECRELGLTGEYKRTGSTLIAIPRDDNNNQVADIWEKAKQVYDAKTPASFDEDKPLQWNAAKQDTWQLRNGDGYTLYEEYRGFMTLRGNRPTLVRTHPNEKDLFFYRQRRPGARVLSAL
jgi:hypothetical protein